MNKKLFFFLIICLVFTLFINCSNKIPNPGISITNVKYTGIEKENILLDVYVKIINNDKRKIKVKKIDANVINNDQILASVLFNKEVVLVPGKIKEIIIPLKLARKTLFQVAALFIINKEIEFIFNGEITFSVFIVQYNYSFSQPLKIDSVLINNILKGLR